MNISLHFNTIVLLSIISFFNTQLYPQRDAQIPLQPKTKLEKLADINMNIFPWQEDSWSTNSWEEFLTRHLQERLNPKPRNKRSSAFKIFIDSDKKNSATQPPTIMFDDTITWQDLNLFCGKTNTEKFVANAIDHTLTEYGKISLYKLLAAPTNNVSLLKKRQDVIQFLIQHEDVFTSLRNLCKRLQEAENATLSFWWQEDPLHRLCEEEWMFTNPLTKLLNNSEAMLTIQSLYNHQDKAWRLGLTLFASAVLFCYSALLLTNICDVPHIIDEWANRYKNNDLVFTTLNLIPNKYIQALVALLSGTYGSLKLKKYYDYLKGGFLFEDTLHTIIQSMAISISTLHEMYNIITKYPILKEFEEFKELEEFFEQQKVVSNDLERFFYNLEDETLYQTPSLLSDKGVIVKTYSLVHKIKDFLAQALVTAGTIDTYVGLADLYKTHRNKSNQYSFATYIENEDPIINLQEFWHPLVDENAVVANSIELGNLNRQNIIITGPNEGGKSTTLKSITLCLLMGQTVGLVPAQLGAFTPFFSLATYLNITDDIGAGNSLFKSEVLRTQALLEKLNNLNPGEFSFTAFDEIFNGTSPREGEAAAYSIAKHLDTYKNNICIIATHFPLLTELEELTNSFLNYKVSVILQQNGSITHPHKLERGISNQHVAIDILRNQGFRSSILDTAQTVLQHP